MSSPAAAEPAEEQPTELPALDPVIHAQPRLRVVVALSALGSDDQVTFPRLQELVSMTAGNLSTHLRKLEEAGYVTITKAYRRRTPVTYVALSRSGRRAFEDYTTALRVLLELSDQPSLLVAGDLRPGNSFDQRERGGNDGKRGHDPGDRKELT